MGEMTKEQEAALVGAVEGGVGFAGWHGGIIGTCVKNEAYLRMVGGLFIWHPQGFVKHRIQITGDDPIVEGLQDFEVDTEHYWVLTDGLNRVLATSVQTPEPGDPWHEPVSMPVTWTRQWGKGRVSVCTLGHTVADVLKPPTLAMIRRGMRWAARN
jgi:type 1 glutamine amidotransferase